MLMKVTHSATPTTTTATVSAIVSFPAVLRGVAKGQCADNELIEEGEKSTKQDYVSLSLSLWDHLQVTTCCWGLSLSSLS